MKITQQTSGLSYFQKIICAGEKIAGTQTAKNSYEQTITEKTMFPKYNNIIRRFAQIVNEAVKKNQWHRSKVTLEKPRLSIICELYSCSLLSPRKNSSQEASFFS